MAHRIHVWYIYLHLHLQYHITIKINQMLVNIPYMDPMGGIPVNLCMVWYTIEFVHAMAILQL